MLPASASPAALAPLDASATLGALLRLSRPGELCGVWFAGAASGLPPVRVRVSRGPVWTSLVIGADLGTLARDTAAILVAQNGEPVRLEGAALFRLLRSRAGSSPGAPAGWEDVASGGVGPVTPAQAGPGSGRRPAPAARSPR